MQLSDSITAVVTGGASGLGAATARRLASHDVKVALFDLNAELGERVAGEIGSVFCKVDVTSDAEVDAGFSRSRGLIGQERILVNCAGIGGAFKTAGRDRETGEIRHHPLDSFDPPLLQGAPERVKASLAASVPFPKRLGQPEEYAALAELMITNGYFNGESVRLDGAIRMAPR